MPKIKKWYTCNYEKNTTILSSEKEDFARSQRRHFKLKRNIIDIIDEPEKVEKPSGKRKEQRHYCNVGLSQLNEHF